MLINYSNHPSNPWPENQHSQAIKQFSQIIDEPFPYIDPALNISQLHTLANSEFQRIHNKYKHSNYAMHIMGEHTYIFLIIQLFLHHNIPCYASTTHRILSQQNNIKQSQFQFIKFRPYQLVQLN